MSLESLPVEWYLLAFTDLLDVQGGTQPPKSEFIDQPHEGYIRLLQIRDFGSKPVPTYIPITKKLKTCQKDDILIARYGASLGRICSGMEGAYNVALAKVVTPLNIEKAFLKYFLRSDHFQQPLMLLSRSAQNGFNKEDLTKFPFILPALAEQQEIVRQLDVMLAQVEQIKARLDAIPAILKKFRQSILADAVSGKLTEEWRAKNNSFTTNQVALEKEHHDTWVAHKEQYSLKGKYKKPHIVNEEHCFEIPQSWLWSNLGQLCWSVKDGPHFSPKYSDTGIPFISGGNIRPNKIDFSNCKYISEELNEELSKRCKPEFGDLLYTKGGTTGIAHLNQENKNFNVWVHVAVLKIINLVNGKYLQHALNSPHCYEQSQLYTHGVGNQDLGLTRLINITVPLPPQEEQLEIVRSIEHHHRLAEHIESLLESAKKRVNLLTQSILAKAFSGELTAEWREQHQDLITGVNSAEALLAKIQAEREASKPVKKAKKVK